MKIKPKANYSMEGYGKLNKDRIYTAKEATNLPNWRKEGKIFVASNDDCTIEFLLKRDEYTIVTIDHLPLNLQSALEWFDNNRQDFTSTDHFALDAINNYILTDSTKTLEEAKSKIDKQKAKEKLA